MMALEFQLRYLKYRIIVRGTKTAVAIEVFLLGHERQQQDYGRSIDITSQRKSSKKKI